MRSEVGPLPTLSNAISHFQVIWPAMKAAQLRFCSWPNNSEMAKLHCLELAEDPLTSDLIYLHTNFQIHSCSGSPDMKNVSLSCSNTSVKKQHGPVFFPFLESVPRSQPA